MKVEIRPRDSRDFPWNVGHRTDSGFHLVGFYKNARQAVKRAEELKKELDLINRFNNS